ncbi:MAG TPA: endonuclease/exonuclease/phosphatase family protein [Pyrinomonadaceae bacterium]|nr:endonuclease/exonuclease/phosphatase family protein [Pyrinomonadaceae bacterium]
MFSLSLTPFLLLLLVSVAFAQPKSSVDDPLLEVGKSPRTNAPTTVIKELRIVTYNIRWRAGDQLKQIANWLKEKQPAVIALQEVDRARKRTDKTNTARALAEQLGMFYAWAAPPPVKATDEEETGVELLSPYPISDVARIVLPNQGPGGRSRVALGATIKVGKMDVRVYSVHAENRLSESKKVEQLNAVLADLARLPKSTPAIVMGDFNTWEPAMVDRARELFTKAGFTTPFPDGRATFQRKIVFYNLELKLDWIWLRGFESKSFDIDRSFTVSDHFPLSTTVMLKQNGEPSKDGSPK